MLFEKPLVSILMVTYNHEKFIAFAIESVLASSYDYFELIVVDDFSKDNTYSIALSYQEKDPRVKLYRNEQNIGDYPNRNKAASYATGKYLKYLDGDDMIYPDSLKIMVHAMERYPEAALGLQQQITDDFAPYPILVNQQWVIRTHFLERGVLNSGPSGAIFKTDIFRQIGGFSGEKFVGDSDLWIRMAFKYPVILLQPSLVWWRIHPAQESKNEARDRNMILVRYKLYKKFIATPECPITDKDKRKALLKLNRRFIMNVFLKLKNGEGIRYSISLLKDASISLKDFLKAILH